MGDYGRGDQPDWRPEQGAPGYGPAGPPPGQGGYAAAYPGQPPQGPPPYDPPPGSRGAPTTAMPAGGPPPAWPPPPEQAPPGFGGGQNPGFGDPSSGYGPSQPPPGYQAPPRRKGPIIIAVVAVLAVIAGGGVGLFFWLSGRGGADTPTAAVQLLASDLATDNYLDAFSRLHPAEATLFNDANSVITDELERLQVLKPGADLGLGSIQVADLVIDEAAAEQVRENVVINKVTGGTITFDQSDLPFTDAFAQRAFPDGMAPSGEPTVVNIADLVARSGEPIRLASVRVDGQWYVSLFYTVADYALQSEGLAWPSTSVPANGAATPEDALKQTVQAALDGDINRLVELADPSELQVIHDVGPVIVAEVSGEASGAQLVELETTETDVRGHTGLGLNRVVVEAEGQQVTVERAGECVNVTVDGSSQQFCSTDIINLVGDTGDPTVQRVLPRLIDAVLNAQVVTTQVDGKHYVSPGQTLVSLYASGLGALEPQDVLDLLDAAN